MRQTDEDGNDSAEGRHVGSQENHIRKQSGDHKQQAEVPCGVVFSRMATSNQPQ